MSIKVPKYLRMVERTLYTQQNKYIGLHLISTIRTILNFELSFKISKLLHDAVEGLYGTQVQGAQNVKFPHSTRSGLQSDIKKFKGPQMQNLIVIQDNLTVNEMKKKSLKNLKSVLQGHIQ